MIKLAVIADDITGANDTAVQFAKRGVKSCVQIEFAQEELLQETADVLVIDTDSRDIPAAQAYSKVQTVCKVLQRNGVQHIYKKIDSTLRGNLGAEIEAADTVFQPEAVVIAPAFPSNNRVTVGGYHLLNYMPIELTEIANAPKSPVRESRIVELLQQQTDCRIGLISLSTVIAGAQAVQQAMNECLARGERWMVFDAVLDEHLTTVATAAETFKSVLWSGSAGLAEQLSRMLEWPASVPEEMGKTAGAVLMVAGSVSKVTQAQVAQTLTLPGVTLVKMQADHLFLQRSEEIRRCVKAAKTALGQGYDVLLSSAVDDQDVRAAVAAGQEKGLDSCAVSEATAVALAEIAAQLGDCNLAGMVLTGGDTAIHVCRELGAKAIRVVAEVATGIPLGRLAGGQHSGLRVVTKAGAFGDEDAFVLARQAIRQL